MDMDQLNTKNNNTVLERLTSLEEQVADTHRIVQKMRNGQRWATVLRLLYWCILLGLGAASYNVLKPYLGQLESLYGMLPGITQQNMQQNTQ